MDHFDVLVIGAGSGGVRAARLMANNGARVAIVENSDFGGTCVNLGCIPKKLFTYAAHYREDFSDSASFGWQVSPNPPIQWNTLVTNKNKEISRLNSIYKNLLEGSGVTCIQGKAQFVDAHKVQVGPTTYQVGKVLIATGSWPWVPPIPGHEHAITSNEAFHLKELPRSVAIVGGGYIAVEFASIFKGLGCDTSLLYRGDNILRNFDHSVSAFVQCELKKKGIAVKTNTQLKAIEKRGSGLTLALDSSEKLEVDLVMYATGRKPRTEGLNLADAKVETDQKGAIVVDRYYQTSQENIYAIGDVIGKVQLTPVAIAEAKAVAETIALGKPTDLDYSGIPTAVFCNPNIGTVGLTETQARLKYDNIQVYTSTFRYLKHTLTQSNEEVFMKIIVDNDSDRVIGVHMVGPDAGEIIQGMAVALKAGVTKTLFDSTIGIHPTIAEEFVTMT